MPEQPSVNLFFDIFFGFGILCAGLSLLFLLFIPYWIARRRGLQNQGWILVLTILGFVALIPWFIALGWALTSDATQNRISPSRSHY